MTADTSTLAETPGRLTSSTVQQYRDNGFVRLPGVLTRAEVDSFAEAARHVYDTGSAMSPDDPIFRQIVNVWRFDDTLRRLTTHTLLATYATQLAGIPLRLWHDQLLAKKPHNGAATEYHQDAPYWPHDRCRHSLSAWVALVDVPVERGCMTFVPGQHHRRDIRAADLSDKTDLFDAAPDLVWESRVTVPLRAGDVTFHNGYTPHTANPNDTDAFRFAFVNIYVDRQLTFNGRGHPCTDTLGIPVGAPLPDEYFPPFDTEAAAVL